MPALSALYWSAAAPGDSGTMHKNKGGAMQRPILWGALAVTILAGSVVIWGAVGTDTEQPMPQDSGQADMSSTSKQTGLAFVRGEQKLLFTGGYADPVMYRVGDTYHMLLNRFGPSFSPNENGYFLLTSTDGETWTEASKTLFPGIATGRVAAMNGVYRFYYPTQAPTVDGGGESQKIISAQSADGKAFTADPGVRIQPRDGYSAEGVTVFALSDGTYRMYFNENLDSSKEQKVSEIWGASSADGLEWTRDTEATIVSDIEGGGWKQVLHPFVVERPRGGYVMFYNSHSQIFYATSDDGKTWKKHGRIIADGADADGYYVNDTTLRLFYGDFDPATGGVVYEVTLTEQG